MCVNFKTGRHRTAALKRARVRVDVRCVWVSRVVVCLSALFVGSGSRVCPVRG